MRILFDHGIPTGLARALPGHTVTTAQAQGGDRLSNGDLLTEAEADGFDLLITTDRRIRYQQNLSGRRIALLVLEAVRSGRGSSCISRTSEPLSRAWRRAAIARFRFLSEDTMAVIHAAPKVSSASFSHRCNTRVSSRQLFQFGSHVAVDYAFGPGLADIAWRIETLAG